MKRPANFLIITAIISGIATLSVLAWFGYLSEAFVPNSGNSDIAIHSALLPKTWDTYYGDGWSVGYPTDYEPEMRESDGAVSFSPNGLREMKTYFLVTTKQGSLDALRIAQRADGYSDPDSVMIANYPAVKYTIGNHRVEYYIDYRDRLLVVASDDPDDEVISIMLATFAILSK